MKTGRRSMWWLGLALACGALAFTGSAEAGKPVKPPAGAEYVAISLGGLRSSDGRLSDTAVSDINDAGQVVGITKMPGYPVSCSQGFVLDPLDANGDGVPDTWFVDAVQNATGKPGPDGQNDLIVGLGNLEGALAGEAMAVNDLGMVVGKCEIPDHVTSPSRFEAFILVPEEAGRWYEDVDGDGVNDLLLPIGSLPGYQGKFVRGLNLNNVGQVVGFFGNMERGFLLTPEVDAQGVRQWFRDDGTGANALMVDLGFIPCGINDRGQIAGYVGFGERAVLRDPDGSLTDLWAPGVAVGFYNMPINSGGQIALSTHLSGAATANWHAWLLTPEDTDGDGTPDLWRRDDDGDGVNDLMQDLGTVDSCKNSGVAVHGLSDTGSVVGLSYTWNNTWTQRHAPYLWRGGVSRSLGDLTSQMKFWDVYAINVAGQIVCRTELADAWGNGNAYVLLPTAP